MVVQQGRDADLKKVWHRKDSTHLNHFPCKYNSLFTDIIIDPSQVPSLIKTIRLKHDADIH